MELKYYLRGLGLGIVITAIIMGITSSRSNAMTDEEIIARAKQLGMIEDRVLSEAALEDAESNSGDDENVNADEDSATGEDDSVQTDDVPDENNISSEPAETSAADDALTAALPDDEETGQEETQTEPGTQNAEESQETTEAQDASTEAAEAERKTESSDMPMVVTVGSGDGSYTVSKKLEDVGAVESASAFDTFLCENGYDKKIRAGSYTIPADAGEEQIARMITGLE